MFEIGDIVKFRNWSNRLWEEGTWIVIEIDDSVQFYDTIFYSYAIQNQLTGEIESKVNWQQIEHYES